jgi:hypothetical protein
MHTAASPVPQHVVPAAQGAPVVPQRVWHEKPPPSFTHSCPALHGEPRVPQVHTVAPPMTEQALAVAGSHAFPQAPQWLKLVSVRPAMPLPTERFTQLVPQQRWVEGHAGEQAPGGPESNPPPSTGGVPGTQTLARQTSLNPQRLPQ